MTVVNNSKKYYYMSANISSQIQHLLAHSPGDDQTLLDHLRRLVDQHEANGNSVEKIPAPLSELVQRNIDRIEQGLPETERITTGIQNLDSDYGGFATGEFVVIGGRPGMGKTQFLVQVAGHIALTHPVLFFSYDMPKYQLTGRFIANFSGVPFDRQRALFLTDDQSEALMATKSEAASYRLFVETGFHDSIAAFKAYCVEQIVVKGIKVIVVDYLQLMSSRESGAERIQQLSAITREMKSLARDYDVCVMASSQLSRGPEARGGEMRPILRDLRECGTIEQDADKVIFIYRPFYYGFTHDENGDDIRRIMELEIAKNRSGRTGIVKLVIGADFTDFRDLDDGTSVVKFRPEW